MKKLKLKLKGFRLGRRLATAFKWVVRPRRKPARLRLLDSRTSRFVNPVSGILAVGRYLRRRAKTLSVTNSGTDYIQLGKEKPVEVPKGHMAVYVGESGGEARQAVVPVVYFNHPLFGELLKEAERVYGYNHPGRIIIPCGYSEFEKVTMRIASWDGCHRRNSWRHTICR